MRLMSFKRKEKEINHDEVTEYRTYSVRYYGLLMLVFLNITSALNWTIFAPAPQFAADYFNTSLSTVNWFANVYLLCYLVSSPLSSLAFDRYNLKLGVCSESPKPLNQIRTDIFILFHTDCDWSRFANAGSMAPLFLNICEE